MHSSRVNFKCYHIPSKERRPRMCGHRSKYARSLVPATLFLRPDRDVCAGMDLYRRYAASRLQAKGRRCYLSQNIGLAVSGSAGPAPPPLNLLSNCSFEVICECWPVDLMTSINFHLCACVCVCVCVCVLTMWSSVGGVLERVQLFILAEGLKTKFSVGNIK